MRYLRKVATTPLSAVAKVIDSLTPTTNERSNAPSIRAVREAINENWLSIYPIGSIYMAVNDNDPSEIFGGTWQRIKDKFILASGDTYTNGETGGEATHNYTPQGTVGGHTLTIHEIPTHTHSYSEYGTISQQVGSGTSIVYNITPNPVGNTGQAGGGQSHNHTFTGSAVTFDNLPPYLAVNVWVRTA